MCLALSQSARASSRPQCALCAAVVHTFWPLITHLLPRLSARVTAPAMSEPLPGSLNSWHQVSSPVRMRFRNFSLCRSVPCARIVAAASVRMPALATPTAPILANSSSTMALNFTGRSRPYHSLGQCGAPQPEFAELLAPFDEAEIGIPVGLQPGADFGADALFRRFGGVVMVMSSPQCAQCCIIFSRCSLASPNRISLDLARLNQRWVSLSQVKPMPPCICTAWMAVCR